MIFNMKFKKRAKLILLSTAFSFILSTPAFSQAEKYQQPSLLEGDAKLACEAVLCLSTGTRPHECSASIRRFFSIWDRKPWKIPDMRFNFLQLCPISSQTPNSPHSASASEMREYMRVISRGATMCSANYLNQTHWRMVKVKRRGGSKKEGHYDYYIERRQVIPTLPPICQQYLNHRLTDGTMLQTLKYDVKQIDSGVEFGQWRDNLMEIDASSFTSQDNSKG